jgi:hypothetical protein
MPAVGAFETTRIDVRAAALANRLEIMPVLSARERRQLRALLQM